jgi:hypothetical protein
LLEGAVVCLSHGHTRTRAVRTSADGHFELAARDLAPGGYELTIYAGAREARRRSFVVDADVHEDIGAVGMVPSEYAAGLHGVLWDGLADVPLTAGRVRLQQHGATIGESGVGNGGAFDIQMTCDRPLPPGAYDVVAEAPGHVPRQVQLEVTRELTIYALGRLELRAGRAGDAD